MPELGTSGSVRGAAGDGRPYRDRAPRPAGSRRWPAEMSNPTGAT